MKPPGQLLPASLSLHLPLHSHCYKAPPTWALPLLANCGPRPAEICNLETCKKCKFSDPISETLSPGQGLSHKGGTLHSISFCFPRTQKTAWHSVGTQ